MNFFPVCFGIMVAMLGIWVEVGTAQTITDTDMPDANLRAAVLARLQALSIVGSTDTTFTRTDMADSGFTVFSASRKSITDITGLEHATSLVTVSFFKNSITTIPDLSALSSLTTLNFKENSITTVVATHLPTSLQKLHLQENSISTLPDLSSLTSLTHLYANNNSLSALPTLPSSLQEIRISNTTLGAELGLDNNSISTLPDLSSLTSLKILYLYNNSISAIPTTLPINLQQLDLSGNSISDISGVSRLTNLNTLWLGNNNISDISALASLSTNLLHLGIGNNNISDISVLENLKTKLKSLYLNYNEISDLSPVSKLTALTTLYLTGTKITTTDMILPLTNLISLDISGHRITDVGEFQKLATIFPYVDPPVQFLYIKPYPAPEFDLSKLNDPEALRAYLYVPPPTSVDTPPPAETTPVKKPPKRKITFECPVGWVRSDGFAGRNRRVLLYEVKLEMDIHNRVSIYKPVWVAIYVHPDEGLENLDGWKLQVALPHNHHREYLLTTENSVVVASEIEGVEGGFAFIENPKETPFPMVGMGFMASLMPGFDYRLYDDRGRKVDFGIACYKRGDIFQVLKNMEDPSVFRKIPLETFNWDADYIRSEWTVPVPAPAAPSLVKKSVVGTWGDLKKQ